MVGNLPQVYGGVATHCYYLTKNLVSLGHTVFLLDVIPYAEKNLPEGVKFIEFTQYPLSYLLILFVRQKKYRILTLQLIRIVGLHRLKNIRFATSLILNLQNNLENQTIDVIHSHHIGIRSLAAYLFAKAHQIPFIMTAHGAEITVEENWQKEKRLITHLLDTNRQIITVSKFTAKIIREKGFAGKLTVIPNGIDMEAFQEIPEDIVSIRQKYKIPEDKKMILFLSSFKNWKGPDVYLRSLPFVKQPFHGIMVGNDLGYWNSCQKLAKELDLQEKVGMYRNIPSNEVVAMYHIADVFVFPTKFPSEGFGIVALEAMATSTPVVASRIAAIPEIVKNGITGLLFEPNNHVDLAAKINQILSDPALGQQLRENGIRKVRTSFNWKRIAEQVQKVYKEII